MMSFAAFKMTFSETSKTPFQEWLDRKNPDAIFKYSKHYGYVDHWYIYFEPAKDLIYIQGDHDYYTVDIIATLIVDRETKTVKIDRIFCENLNHWPEMFVHPTPLDGVGGISRYKQNMDFFKGYMMEEISLDHAVKMFFGDWKLVIPMTRPFLDNAKDLVKDYKDVTGEWDRVVGTFTLDKNKAATIIQKYYRGWKVRLKICYDPETTLGKYLIMKMFNN